ncbi:O-antigen ligase family protein, partial [Candidatus Falkowbacteria bacterium]|nr:O-antigen ligase family protein [Candidatus Falkowbacteria bacterium]
MPRVKKIIIALICLYVFLIPLQTHWLYDQKLINDEPWQYGALKIFATELLFFVILCLAIFYFFKKSWAIITWRFSWLKTGAIFSLLLMCALNFYFAINRDIAFYKLTIYIQALALFFLLFAVRIGWEKISCALVLSGAVQSIFAIIQFASQKVFASKWLGMASQNPATFRTPVVETTDGRWLRAFGTFSHPNILAGFLVFAILCGIYLLMNKGTTNRNACPASGGAKIMLAGSIALNSVGLAFTFSRAAIIALFIALVFLIFFFVNKQNREDHQFKMFAAALGLIVISFLCISLAFPSLILTRVNGGQRLEVKSNSERIAEYKMAPTLFKNYWLFGVGAGNYTLAKDAIQSQLALPKLGVGGYQPIHNAILLEIIEFGIVGILLLIGFVISILKIAPKLFLFNSFSTLLLSALLILSIFDHYLSS